MTKDEALKKALAALEGVHQDSTGWWNYHVEITAIKEALAQPEQEQLQPVWGGGPTNKDVEDAMRLKRLNQLAAPTKGEEHINRIITVKEANEWADKLWAECVKQAYAEPDKKEEHMTHTINATQTAAVATDYYWIPIDKDTPHGVKLQLLGKGGVAQYSSYHGDPFWSHWAPLPKRRD